MLTVHLLIWTTVIVVAIFFILFLLKKTFLINRYLLYLSIILIILGPVLTAYQQESYYYFKDIQKWPVIQAEVSESKVIGERAVLPEITYKYTISGKVYSSTTNLDTPGFGNRKKRGQTARIIIDKYQTGKKIDIRYNPSNPSEARIKISPPWNMFGKIGLGLYLYSMGLFGVLFYFFKRRK